MPIEIQMPALSPTMEKGTIARWLVKQGDTIASGDVIAEIETDKATMEIEADNDGVILSIEIGEGTDDVAVGTVIALLGAEDEDSIIAKPKPEPGAAAPQHPIAPATQVAAEPKPVAPAFVKIAKSIDAASVNATPLARRLADTRGIDLSEISGTGPRDKIVKADLGPWLEPEARAMLAKPTRSSASTAIQFVAQTVDPGDIPHEIIALSGMRKTIARRLTEAKQQIPHIYLTVDCCLDALLELRTELNHSLSTQQVKLSVNDMMIKALARSLMAVPKCNVAYSGDSIVAYHRTDISVAVSLPKGLITPIVSDADTKSLSAISNEVKDLAARAREGKLAPSEYQGGTASISNMGMYGIRQFAAIINPPQATILAIGAGDKRPWVIDEQLTVATIMTVTGSFDHRAIDGADGAQLMQAFRELVESPLQLVT